MDTTLRTIVVGVATADELDPVLPCAVRLAREAGASLRVVHVFNPPDTVVYAGSSVPVNLGVLHRCGKIEAVASALEQQCAHFAEPGQDVRVEVLTGSAHRMLARFAADAGAHLLVVGATRRGPLLRRVLGTTAERVLHQSAIPVLVVHRPFFRRVERVLLTTDLSAFSAGIHERALDALEGVFPASRLQLRSLLVLDSRFTPAALLPAEALERRAGEGLERFLGDREPRGHAAVGRVRVGEPPAEINAEADAWNADLVVVGTHGRSGLARYVFGSVAAATLRDAVRNVLVIPAVAGQPLGSVREGDAVEAAQPA